jgi:hypothetical protein
MGESLGVYLKMPFQMHKLSPEGHGNMTANELGIHGYPKDWILLYYYTIVCMLWFLSFNWHVDRQKLSCTNVQR